MIINPIIPIWAMTIICIIFLVLKRRGIFNYVRQIIAVVLIFVINLRLTIPSGFEQQGISLDIDVLFVIDNTISMLAEDYNGNERRLDAVKEDCRYIVENFKGASFSVVTFDNEVLLRTPYTVDTNMTIQTINMLKSQGKLYAKGTSLNDAMKSMEGFLNKNRNTYQIVIFISDGELTKKNKLDSFPELAQYVDAGVVLGYGTDAGGPMKVIYYPGSDEEPEYLYYYDSYYNRKQAISKIDEKNLKSIAKDFGVEYVHMTEHSQIKDVLKGLQKNTPVGTKVDKVALSGDKELYYYFTIPLALIMIYDFVYYRRRIFRKGQ